MSRWHDLIDWVGGYPYEVAKADENFSFFRARGFALDRLRTLGGMACNEFVFSLSRPDRSGPPLS
jgi:2-polyprenyl-6-hydroxyphenyl methylase/3-demethylubiquinone-9 3-methyltransferase